jgi:flagellar biosynthesis/type III secretory pathway protein FliH
MAREAPYRVFQTEEEYRQAWQQWVDVGSEQGFAEGEEQGYKLGRERGYEEGCDQQLKLSKAYYEREMTAMRRQLNEQHLVALEDEQDRISGREFVILGLAVLGSVLGGAALAMRFL